MSRLFIFLFGVLVGAAGLFFLFHDELRADRRGRDDAGARIESVDTPSEPPSEIERPPLPAIPPPTELGDTQLTLEPPTPPQIPAEALPPEAIEPAQPTVLLAALPTDKLLLPVAGVKPEQLLDTYTQTRGAGRLHDAIDIMAPRGTPVLAVDDGRVAKLFNSKQGGLTVYQFDPKEKLAYYYAHLDSYADGVVEGKLLKRGDLVGHVGSTGNANPSGPHLHFAVFVLGPEKNWWQGTAINPYPLLGGKPTVAATPIDSPSAGPKRH